LSTEDNPDIKIEYGSELNVPPSSWIDLISDARSFEIVGAGILKVPYARIILANKDGKYTDGGADSLVYWRPFRIRADVREGVFDTIFYGRLYGTEGDIKGKKTPELTLTCRCLGRKLLEDTITRPYHDIYPVLTMKECIEDFLLNPDSSVDTGITLETDSGVITTTYTLHNPEKDTLQDILRDICEKIDYDGYVYVNDSGNIKLWLKKIGTVACDPSMTLQHPYIDVKAIFDIDEIKNHIFVWGDIDAGVPPDMDQWTEKDITTNWTSPYSGCTISEDTTDYQFGKKSMKASRGDAAENIGGLLTIPDPQSPVDCTIPECSLLSMLTKHVQCRPFTPIITLTDDDTPTPNKIEYKSSMQALSNVWVALQIPIGTDREIVGDQVYQRGSGAPNTWYLVQGSASAFSWKITEIEAWTTTSDPTGGSIKVDKLYFVMPKPIDPLKYSSLQRVSASFPYGRRVHHHEDKEIRSFSQGQEIGDYILNVNKNMIKKVTVTCKGKTWARVSQHLTFNLPEYGINNELWRITELRYEWQRPKHLRTTFTLVPKDQFVGSQAYLADTLEGMLKYR